MNESAARQRCAPGDTAARFASGPGHRVGHVAQPERWNETTGESMRTILVTGGAGFIGGTFVRKLLLWAPQLRVVNLDALRYSGNLERLADCMESPRHVFVRGSIGNFELVAYLLRHYGVEGIVNLAAESHVDRSIADPAVFVRTNVQGTATLLMAAREAGVDRFLQVSTDEVYGSLGPEGLFREDSPLTPNSPYSASKAGADQLTRAFHQTYGLNTVITRCSNNYGPYQHPEKMIPLIIRKAMNDEPLPVYGDGLQVRDWLHVDDHCRALWTAYRHGRAGSVYNIGACNERTNLEVVRTILRHLGKSESLIRHVEDRPGHDRRYALDASLMMRELGWTPRIDFNAGLAATIQWYANRDGVDTADPG